MTFDEIFERSLRRTGLYDVISGASSVCVAFSGGADSAVLLSMLRRRFPDADLRALHVNHMIRGEAADADEEHCRRFCRDLGVELTVRRVDVPAVCAREKIGIEQAAREERYRIFDEYLADAGDGALIATAHNADDNLETVIFNLIRGSAARGLSGIAPRRGNVVRPMLFISSADIREYAESASIPFVIDETNSDTRYTRNRLRREVIPLLREIVPACAENAAVSSSLLRRDDVFLFSEAANAVAGRREVPISSFGSQNDAVLSRALLLMYTEARGERTDLTSVNLADCIRLIRSGKRGEICLPGAISMILRDKTVSFVPTEREKHLPRFCRTILQDGFAPEGQVFVFPEGRFSIAVDDACDPPRAIESIKKNNSGINIYKISIYTTIEFAKIKGSLFARNRLPGDTITIGGMRRKLKKLLCDKKIPERETLPVICDNDGVLFVPGIGLRDNAAASDPNHGVRITVWR